MQNLTQLDTFEPAVLGSVHQDVTRAAADYSATCGPGHEPQAAPCLAVYSILLSHVSVKGYVTASRFQYVETSSRTDECHRSDTCTAMPQDVDTTVLLAGISVRCWMLMQTMRSAFPPK